MALLLRPCLDSSELSTRVNINVMCNNRSILAVTGPPLYSTGNGPSVRTWIVCYAGSSFKIFWTGGSADL